MYKETCDATFHSKQVHLIVIMNVYFLENKLKLIYNSVIIS